MVKLFAEAVISRSRRGERRAKEGCGLTQGSRVAMMSLSNWPHLLRIILRRSNTMCLKKSPPSVLEHLHGAQASDKTLEA